MQLSYKIRTLTEEDMPNMYQAFMRAFSDYQVNFKMDQPTFRRRFMHKLKIQFDFSVGVFHENRMIGFIFHALNDYRGQPTLYNGGTGVDPVHRGKRLVEAMYDFILPIARKANIHTSILEVLTKNEKAIKAYQNSGFNKVNKYLCFKAQSLNLPFVNQEISIEKPQIFDPSKYQYFHQGIPSFQDTNEHLIYNADYETILEAVFGKKVVGYLIFQQLSGRISQFAVQETYQQKGIGTRLLLACQKMLKLNQALTLINLSEEDVKTRDFLMNRGFKNEVDQYEMRLSF